MPYVGFKIVHVLIVLGLIERKEALKPKTKITLHSQTLHYERRDRDNRILEKTPNEGLSIGLLGLEDIMNDYRIFNTMLEVSTSEIL